MSKDLQPSEKIKRLGEQLKILGEPNRLLILNLLMEGVQCNCELGDALQMAPNLISHHLSILREAGLIESERDPVDGRWVYYSINLDTMDELRSLFGNFFDTNRIQPRGSACGPRVTEEQKQSLMRMTKK